MLYAWLWILYAVAIGIFTARLLREPSSLRKRVLIVFVALGLLTYLTAKLAIKLDRHPPEPTPVQGK
jgi:membrane protein DedA with SNARE-associated domain